MRNIKVKQEFLNLGKRLHAAPMMFADVFGVNPELLEKLLVSRGQLRGEESIGDALQRHYGKAVAEECERLIDESPFEGGKRAFFRREKK